MGVHFGREAWTKTRNAAVATKRDQVHVTWHYPGFGTDAVKTAGWDLERCFAQLRAWRNMHVGSGKYREVAYNLYALPTGDVVDGRGNRQNGANGTSTANRAGMSVQVLIGDNEELTAGHLAAILLAMTILERWHPGITRRQYPHSHWVGTRCPGPIVRGRIPFPLSAAPSTPLAVSGKAWRASPRVAGMTAAEVRKVQELVGATVDGKYGDETGAAVLALQEQLEITADGVFGPGTEETMARLEQKIDRLVAIATENQRRITEVLERVGPIRRDGKDVSLRQEVADTKTLALEGRVDLRKAVAQTSPIRRAGVDVSLRQEVADAKTLAMANTGTLGEIQSILERADVDTAAPAPAPEVEPADGEG